MAEFTITAVLNLGGFKKELRTLTRNSRPAPELYGFLLEPLPTDLDNCEEISKTIVGTKRFRFKLDEFNYNTLTAYYRWDGKW